MCYFEQSIPSSDHEVIVHWEKVYEDSKFINSIYFHDRYPIESSKIKVEIPKNIEVNLVDWNFERNSPVKTIMDEREHRITTYSLTDLEAFNRSESAPARSKVYAHIIPIPAQINTSTGSEVLLKDVSNMYEWHHTLATQIDNDQQSVKPLALELTADKESDLDKIKEIFYWVQDNIRYIAFEYGIMGFQPDNCQNVLNKKYGDCKGMANLIKEMLISLDYDARLTWIGTNDIPYDYSIPSLLVDNHMICSVMLGDSVIFLDATEKFSDIGLYGQRIQGRQALIEDGSNYKIVEVPQDKLEVNKKFTYQLLNLKDDKLVGEAHTEYFGNSKTWILNILFTSSATERKEMMERILSQDDKNYTVELQNPVASNYRDVTVRFDYTVSHSNRVIDLGNESYLNPDNHFLYKEAEIDTSEKNSDRSAIDLGETKYFEEIIDLNIPKGHTVTHLPEKVFITNSKYHFDLHYSHDETVITLKIIIKIIDPILYQEEFKAWNMAISQLSDFYSDQIILKHD